MFFDQAFRQAQGHRRVISPLSGSEGEGASSDHVGERFERSRRFELECRAQCVSDRKPKQASSIFSPVLHRFESFFCLPNCQHWYSRARLFDSPENELPAPVLSNSLEIRGVQDSKAILGQGLSVRGNCQNSSCAKKFTLPACFRPLDLRNHPIQLINQRRAGPSIAECANEGPVVPQNLIAGTIEAIPKNLS